jgi:hypothetical protein
MPLMSVGADDAEAGAAKDIICLGNEIPGSVKQSQLFGS